MYLAKACVIIVVLSLTGAPAPPANVSVSSVSPQVLNVSWSAETDPNINTSFQLTVTHSQESVLHSTPHLFLLLPLNVSECTEFSFEVVASNAAGASEASPPVTRSLPWLPDIRPVETSLQHSVRRDGSSVTILITHQVG